MKNLYARFVLFLIRPAVQRALREETGQGGILLADRTAVANVWRFSPARSRDVVPHSEGS